MNWKETILAGGKIELALLTKCRNCDGTGDFRFPQQGGMYFKQCPQCHGLGKAVTTSIDLNELIEFIARRQR